MKHTRKFTLLLFIMISFSFLLSGCQKKTAECPFTTITWGSTLEDITSLEGDSQETYDSIYGGTTYTFPKEYDGLKGTVKYMFDDKEKLVGMSWMYESDDSDDLKEVYDRIHEEAKAALGESGYQLNSDKFAAVATPTDVWYLESGNVTLTMVDTSEVKALQYTYLHPDVSEEKP